MVYTSLDHAEHNESTCDFLATATDKHNDWIITTAFYSSMHYLRHKVFPLEIIKSTGKITVSSFEEYCTEKGIYGQKHKVMRKLIEDNCDLSIASTYNQMLDLSFTARYNKYKYGKKIARLAQKRLNAIKGYSVKKVNS